MATLLIYEITGEKNGQSVKETVERAYRESQGPVDDVIELDKKELKEMQETGTAGWTNVQVFYRGKRHPY